MTEPKDWEGAAKGDDPKMIVLWRMGVELEMYSAYQNIWEPRASNTWSLSPKVYYRIKPKDES